MTDEPTQEPTRRSRSRAVALVAAGALALGALGATAISALGDDGGSSNAAAPVASPYAQDDAPAAPIQQGDPQDCPQGGGGGGSGSGSGSGSIEAT
jgi:hypothetical protein